MVDVLHRYPLGPPPGAGVECREGYRCEVLGGPFDEPRRGVVERTFREGVEVRLSTGEYVSVPYERLRLLPAHPARPAEYR